MQGFTSHLDGLLTIYARLADCDELLLGSASFDWNSRLLDLAFRRADVASEGKTAGFTAELRGPALHF